MKPHPENKVRVPRFEERNGFYATEFTSKLMSKIRGTNTRSEIQLRKVLWGLGLRYRKNDRRLPGKPDIVLPKYRIAIFVDGEFWHGHNWRNKKNAIKSNPNFWIPKIERNIQRDQSNNELLRKDGWIVLRFWDQEVKKEFGACVKKILDCIDHSQHYN
jgi:DNA mismatch endonuclease, patch repair protein